MKKILLLLLPIALISCEIKKNQIKNNATINNWFVNNCRQTIKNKGIPLEVKQQLMKLCEGPNSILNLTLVLLGDQENQKQILITNETNPFAFEFANQFCSGEQICFDEKCYCIVPSNSTPRLNSKFNPNLNNWLTKELRSFLRVAKVNNKSSFEEYLDSKIPLSPLLVIYESSKKKESIGSCIGSDLYACEALAISCRNSGGTVWRDQDGKCYCFEGLKSK